LHRRASPIALTAGLGLLVVCIGVPSVLPASATRDARARAAGVANTAVARTTVAAATTSTTTTTTAVTTTTAATTTTPVITTTATQTPTKIANPCLRRALHLRCPDLAMSAPSELHLDTTTIPGRVLLRATSSVNDLGAGPIELRAHRGARRRWVVEQAIYDRRGHARLFHTRVRLVYKYVPGYRYEYGNVGATSYWKVRHLAAFQLWSSNARLRLGRLVRTGPKVDYCLRDLFRTHPSPRSPPAAVYPGCSEEAGVAHDLFGTSVGWSDVYPYGYPEQWIDVTGLRGRYAYMQTVNPQGRLYESSTRNNASETFVALPSGRILGQRVGVQAP
jgi:Lysyl oxidase